MSDARARALEWLAAAVVGAGLVFLWSHRISGAPIETDAAQTTLMALNLERHGVISLDESAPYSPTNYREPVPVIVSAAGIALIDAALGAAPTEAYFSGERARLLKCQNILWLGLLSLGAFWTVRYFTGSFRLALLGALLVNFPLSGSHSEADLIDDLFTDIPAAAVLMLASLAAAVAARGRRPVVCAATGLLFGLLTLIKAATLYIFLGTVGVWAGACLLRRAAPWRILARDAAVMLIAFGCAVGPWMYRNHVLFGSAHIAQRAGVVLMYRAVYDQMTPGEYRGTFYVWAPARLQGIVGRLLGFAPADLKRGGRLQRLIETDSDFAAEDLAAERAGAPERTLSYYRQARAERVELERQLGRAGSPQPEIAADDLLKERALKIVLAHPWRNLALTVSFIWRGATFAFPALILALLVALRRRQYEFFVFAVPAFGTVLLYALFTHFIPRYDAPALSVAIVAFWLSGYFAWRVRGADV